MIKNPFKLLVLLTIQSLSVFHTQKSAWGKKKSAWVAIAQPSKNFKPQTVKFRSWQKFDERQFGENTLQKPLEMHQKEINNNWKEPKKIFHIP